MNKFFKFILKISIIGAAWLSVLAAIILSYYYLDLPAFEELESANSKQIIQINYEDNNKLATFGDIYDNKTSYNELPQHLIDAVIATEDRRFFKHHGVDIFGIMRAGYANYKANRVVQGGSTVTQQLAKLLFLKPEKTIKRKIQEILLAIKMERIFTKEQILTLYLNRAYFGAGNYGIASASKYYFSKPVSKINLNESALLAGLLKAPSKLSPSRNQDLAESRANQVLTNMADAGYLGEENIDDIDRPINYQADKMQRFYFANYAAAQFWDYVPLELKKSNTHFKVKTTLDEEIKILKMRWIILLIIIKKKCSKASWR
jgi:penicillin-binding protein 1A